MPDESPPCFEHWIRKILSQTTAKGTHTTDLQTMKRLSDMQKVRDDRFLALVFAVFAVLADLGEIKFANFTHNVIHPEKSQITFQKK